MPPAIRQKYLASLENLVVGVVALTARAIGEAAPDLTLLQWRVLVVLADAPEGMSVGELAREIGAKRPATSRLLGRLRRRDLVVALKIQSDSRITTVCLTEAGRDLWRRVVTRRRMDLELALTRAGLDPGEGAALARLAVELGRRD